MKLTIYLLLFFVNVSGFAQIEDSFLFTKHKTDGYSVTFSDTPGIFFKKKGYQYFTLDEFLLMQQYPSIPIHIQIEVATKSIKAIKVHTNDLWLSARGPLPLIITQKLEKSLKDNIKLRSLERTGGPDAPKIIERTFIIFIERKFAKKAKRKLKRKHKKK